jgi:hypothetical protein
MVYVKYIKRAETSEMQSGKVGITTVSIKKE